MTGGEQLAPVLPVTRVTYRPQTKEFEVVPESAITPDMNYPGDPDLSPAAITMPEGLTVYRSLRPHLATRVYDEISALYAGLGPGYHSVAAATETLGRSWAKISAEVSRACDVLPPHLVHMENPVCGCQDCKFILFGNLAITSAISNISPEEKQRRDEYFHAKIQTDESLTKAEKEVRERRTAILEADAGKRQLLAFHHALLQIGEEICYLPLDNPEQVLLMRFIQGAKQGRAVPPERDATYRAMPLSMLRNHVWANISLAERELFTSDPFVLYGDVSHVLNEPLRHVWRSISCTMIGGHMLVEPNQHQVRFKDIPIKARYEKMVPRRPYRSFRELRIPLLKHI